MPVWNEIVQRNAAKVLNAALRVLGNLADAEDVSQEVFTEAFRKWNHVPEQQWKASCVAGFSCHKEPTAEEE